MRYPGPPSRSTPDKVRAFLRELRFLCEKHDVYFLRAGYLLHDDCFYTELSVCPAEAECQGIVFGRIVDDCFRPDPRIGR